MHGVAEARQVVAAMDRSPIAIRTLEVELPDRAEGVHLELVVVVMVAIGVEEDLEIGIVEDDRVLLGERREHVRIVQVRTHVEVRVVPAHLDAGLEARRGLAVTFDVHEALTPRHALPLWIVEPAREFDRALDAGCDVPARFGHDADRMARRR